jgi:hypothetical protein
MVDPLTRLATLATLSPKGGRGFGFPQFTLAPLGERVPEERGRVRGSIRHSIMRDSVETLRKDFLQRAHPQLGQARKVRFAAERTRP